MTRPVIESTRSIDRFSTRDERERRSAGSPMSGRPSAVWMPMFVPDHLEEAWDEVDLDVEILERPDEVEHLLVRVVREGDDDALDVQDLDHLRQLPEPAEERDVVEALGAVLGLVVDEADEVEPVFGVLAQLLRDQLPDVAGADDDRVLHVGEMAPGHAARDRPADRDGGDRESQKPSRRAKPGSALWVTVANAKKSQLPTVTRCRTPTRSSAVEWSVRSSS